MIKVLQVIRSLGYDGISNFVMDYYRHIDRSQFDFHFTSSSREPDPLDAEILSLGGTIHKLPSRNRKPVDYMRELYRLLKREHFDIVHIEQNSASMAMDAFVCRLCGVRVIIGHSHNTSCNALWQHHLFKPFVNFLVTHRFACSEEAGKWVFGNNPHVTIVRNAIDATKYYYNEAQRAEIRKGLAVEGKMVVGFVGRLEAQKNLFRCIDIFQLLHQKHNDSVLLLVGDGTQKKSLQHYAAEKGLSESCIFTGRRQDVNHLLQAMDIFLLPSLYEGLGIVCIEAQAADLPCIVSTNVPAPNIIGKCRYVSLDCSDEEWAEAVLSMQSDTRKNQSEAFAHSGYEIHNEAHVLAEYYLSFVGKNGKP